MIQENRGIAIGMCFVTGWMFGSWQDSFMAGYFLFWLLVTLTIIKTVK